LYFLSFLWEKLGLLLLLNLVIIDLTRLDFWRLFLDCKKVRNLEISYRGIQLWLLFDVQYRLFIWQLLLSKERKAILRICNDFFNFDFFHSLGIRLVFWAKTDFFFYFNDTAPFPCIHKIVTFGLFWLIIIVIHRDLGRWRENGFGVVLGKWLGSHWLVKIIEFMENLCNIVDIGLLFGLALEWGEFGGFHWNKV